MTEADDEIASPINSDGLDHDVEMIAFKCFFELFFHLNYPPNTI